RCSLSVLRRVQDCRTRIIDPGTFSPGPPSNARLPSRMEHHFTGPSYTIGIEEELMIVDGESYELVNAIESVLEGDPRPPQGEIKRELMESVLEIATRPCRDTAEAGEALRGLRRFARDRAARLGLAIGSAGTHPLAMRAAPGQSPRTGDRQLD